MIDVRSLFHPSQPTVPLHGNVSYQEFKPHDDLMPFVHCYWELKSKVLLQEDFIYRVISDGCTDVFFEAEASRNNFVMGFCKKYTQFSLGRNFRYFGIRFLPSFFSLLFEVDASSLSNRYEPLQNVCAPFANFISRNILAEFSNIQIVGLLDHFLLDHIEARALDYDPRFYNVFKTILDRSGNISLKEDIPAGLSPRQLRRLFQRYIGTTMKRFSKVVRFQKILQAEPSRQSLTFRNLSFDTGHYDQAHFIKEFKEFYGVTPSEAFGR